MRTTIRLDEELLRDAKRAAVERGTTLTAVIEDALRRALTPGAVASVVDVEIPTFRGDGLQPGVDLDDTASLLDLMDGLDARS